MPEPMNKTEALARLDGLIAANASYKEGEIALLLAEAPAEWDRAIRALGRKEAYGHIADVLCAEYKSRIGREFLFTEACVAYELGYHINAYLWCKGFQGYPRHPSAVFQGLPGPALPVCGDQRGGSPQLQAAHHVPL